MVVNDNCHTFASDLVMVLKNRKIQVIDKNITFKKEKYFSINYVPEPQKAVYNQVDELDGYKFYEVEMH